MLLLLLRQRWLMAFLPYDGLTGFDHGVESPHCCYRTESAQSFDPSILVRAEQDMLVDESTAGLLATSLRREGCACMGVAQGWLLQSSCFCWEQTFCLSLPLDLWQLCLAHCNALHSCLSHLF